jgi:hypothetical protein
MQTRHTKPARHRYFYSISSIILLVLTIVGFRMFYLNLHCVAASLAARTDAWARLAALILG